MPEKVQKLSEIIQEINNRSGAEFDTDRIIRYVIRITEMMRNSAKLKASAQNNEEKDFSFAYFDAIEDAMMDEYDTNREFSKMILENEDMKRQTFGIFEKEMYDWLRGS
ncbi:MAG: hypothetical protein IJ733_04020 [Lachnospiraceae bacterium]|nr:hypothetical protein [Lachnospiraceae bacterium]